MKTIDLKGMTIEELNELMNAINDEIASRKETVKIILEANSFDARKHGGAYVAVITTDEDGKVSRSFIDPVNKVWSSNRKYYSVKWIADFPEGTKLEARLSDGSWKNDLKQYFIVSKDAEDGVKEVTRKDVLGL